MVSLKNADVPFAVVWRKPYTVMLALFAIPLTMWMPYDVHSGHSFFPLQQCVVYVDGKGGPLLHVSPEFDYRVEFPAEWSGRSRVYQTALQSCGFAPDSLRKGGIVVVVSSSERGLSLAAMVEKKVMEGTAPAPASLGRLPALRYTTPDGRVVVSARYRQRRYDLVLTSADAPPEVRAQFEEAVRGFQVGKFI